MEILVPTFPVYKREEKRNIKLSESDIAELREDWKNGKYQTKAEAGRAFNISADQVRYWLMTDEERAAKNKERNKRKRTYNPEVYRRYLDHKLEHDKEGIRKFRNATNSRLKHKNIEAYRAKDRAGAARRRAAKKNLQSA